MNNLKPFSASRLATYQRCPRQYWYRYVLNLPVADSGSEAQRGKLAHKILETFNRQFSPEKPYNISELRVYSDRFFAEQVIFTDLNPLQQRVFKAWWADTMLALEEQGYFNWPLQHIEPELFFKDQLLPQLSETVIGTVTWTATIDAVMLLKDGTCRLIDYKTMGPNRLISQRDTVLKNAQHRLSLLPDDPTLSHAERFASSDTRPRDYQLLLYAWLFTHVRKQPVTQVVYQLLRPEKAWTIVLDVSDSAQQHALQQDVRRWLVEPMLALHQQKTNTPEAVVGDACTHCVYAGICPK